MGIPMKDRLRRLLTAKTGSTSSKFVRKQQQQQSHSQQQLKNNSMVAAEDRTYATGDTCSHETDSNTSDSTSNDGGAADAAAYLAGIDPYADVRERLEELSLSNRKRSGIVPYDDDDDEIPEEEEEGSFNVPSVDAYMVYLSYGILILLGKFIDTMNLLIGFVLCGGWTRQRQNCNATTNNNNIDEESSCYAPLLKSWENFYTRHLYSRVQDAFNRPVCSNPGAVISVLERGSTDDMKTMQVIGDISVTTTTTTAMEESIRQSYTNSPHYTTSHNGNKAARQCLNLGSYNYLGFADHWHTSSCAESVTASFVDFSPSTSSSRAEFGTTILHEQLERIVADFLGKDDALVLNMGFNTNATTIPILMQTGDLILSDELNHTSIVAGARASGAAIRVFGHNDMASLEHSLREAVVMGRPRTRRPWNRIWVLVEGIYSMEGEYSDLRNIVRLAKKYGAYIYLDEAHSIGSMGNTGRGVTEYCGVDTADIDIMMGTFTKSFGGMGGYICADQHVIDVLREKCAGSIHHNALPPIVCQQVITAFQIIMGQDGTTIGRQKLQALRDNSNYLRMRLKEIGLHVLGQYDSPVLPVMLFEPGKIMNFTRECYKRGLAVVVVGFPAVPLVMSRARFCVSAAHTRPQLDRAVAELEQVAKICRIRYKLDQAKA